MQPNQDQIPSSYGNNWFQRNQDALGIGEVHLDCVQRAYSSTCQVIGDEGTIRWDYTAGEVRWYSAAMRESQVLANPLGWDQNRMYLEETRRLLRCWARQENAALDAFDAARVLEAGLAAKRSAKTRKVVKLVRLSFGKEA
jgi:predicted dehydrogenase